MHIDVVPNRGSTPTVLLRESFREGAKVCKRTLANLSSLSAAQIEAIRAALRGEVWQPVARAFEIIASRAHGHVQAVAMAMDRLGVASLIASKPSRARDLVLAMVAARIVQPHTKLATTRWWHTTTLADDFGVADASEDDLYAAMDWLLARQDRIQQQLATRHLADGGLVLYDVSSSDVEGTHCPLARRGYSRDGKRGTLQVNYGLITDGRGCPVAVSVHEGNTADSQTFRPAVHQVREDFGIERVVMVGDRGMIASMAIDEMREMKGIDWITALKSASITALVEDGHLQLDLFDERNLLEFSAPEYPDERLVACRNPQLAKLRAHTREDLLAATERVLAPIKARVDAGKLTGQDNIGLRVGRVVNQYKVAKHFALTISDDAFTFARTLPSITAEAALDGLSIIRTSVRADAMGAADGVRHYKALRHVERAFRTRKGVDLTVRPIHHRTADRARAHRFLCLLAYYVEWHMREAWRELTFADTDQHAKGSRHTLHDGTPAHSVATLLADLATIVRNTCRTPSAGPAAPTFGVLTTPSATQQHALALIQHIQL